MDYELLMNGNVKIGMQSPDFEAETTMGNISLNDYKGKWLVFFSHPGDFTPVCTTEIIAFSRAYRYFEKLNTSLLGLSVDSNPSHLAWIYEIYKRTGITVPFPIIADRNGAIARKYGMISNDVSTTETVRNVFIIDDKGIVRFILVYPLNVGRSIPEIIRIVEALQTADENNAATPANWMPCEKIIMPMPKTYSELITKSKEVEKNKNGMGWYLDYKNPIKCVNTQNLKRIEQPMKIEVKNKLQERNTLERKDL